MTSLEGGLPAGEIQITTPQHEYRPLKLGLAGPHQVTNAIGAVRLMESLTEFGVPIAPRAIVDGLTTVTWPGRLDLVQSQNTGTILFDAAHNPAAATTLAAFLRETYPEGLPLVIGAMRDKDTDGMARALLLCATHIVCTTPETPRAMPAHELAARTRRLGGAATVTMEPNPWQAVTAAWRHADTVCVTGSIFLVGQLLATAEARGGTRKQGSG